MPRRKIERTNEEEIEYQRIRREKNAENQRRYREKNKNKKLNNSNDSNDIIKMNLNTEPITLANNREIKVDLCNEIKQPPKSNCERKRNYDARKKGLVSSEKCIDPKSKESKEHYLGKMDILCTHCDAKHFLGEMVANKGYSFNDCCSHGESKLEKLPEFPKELKSLFQGIHSESENFLTNIRGYNSSYAFASFNAKLVNFSSRRPGPYCFKIQGQIYYQINTALHPELADKPSFGQLFIIDANEATNYRSSANNNLNNEVLEILENTMRTHNVFAKSYQMMKNELEKQNQNAKENNEIMPELQLLFTLKHGMDPNRYNIPQTNEVAAVFVTTADGEIPESYLVIRDIKTKTLKYVSSMDPNVEPMIYPLFYPFGTRGWHRNLTRSSSEKRISRGAYSKFHIAVRDEFNPFLLGGRLLQQWVVDSYVKIEKDRLQFFKANQKKIRAESYQELIDYLHNSANQKNARIGKMIILPSTFIGSPRNMMQNYQDAMTIVRHHGTPDIFLTMTCNPNWKEITENLYKGQTPSDRPDLVARVFNLKVKYLMDLIVRKHFFGEVLSFVYVIEFQKRGLPHIHLLIILKPNSKILTSEVIDRYISAEIPSPEIDPILHETVLKHMIHGPCGDWCFKDGKCSKHYPKEYQENTVIDDKEGVFYRRRNTGITYEKSGNYLVDNRHVVPYCPTLLKLINSHINVVLVKSGRRSVKYLYKYIYKGHDSSAIEISEINHDEIKDYIETRYVGPVEATWRILNKSLQKKSHSVTRLPVHLPNQQTITIDDDMNENEMQSVLNQATMLLDYFALNERDENAKNYYYTEIPSHYTFKETKVNGFTIYQWQPRKGTFNVIGRMYSISPTQIELFHLRLLLLSIKGATSFENIKTVNGTVYQTFTDTCVALGLIENDDEWKHAMQEATVWMMPRRLRRLFVRILIHCNPLQPAQLWEEFKHALSEDYIKYNGLITGQNKAYAEINSMLVAEGYSVSKFSAMPEINDNVEINNDTSYEENLKIGSEQFGKLNKEQKEFVTTVLNAVDNNNSSESSCFYIDGPGGSGKTFIYTTLLHLLKSKGKQVCAMAFTGIAATLLPNGKTVHKTFGLPVPLYSDSSSNIKVQSKEGIYLKNMDVFIWDEAPMAPRYSLEIMDRTLQDIMQNDIPFGGKIVILGGDFRQLLPIKENGTRSEKINLSIKFSPQWNYFQKYSLTQNMRVLPNEIEFAKFLLKVGNGSLNNNNDMELPEQIAANVNSNIVEDIYGKLIQEKKFNEISECAILSARNKDVEELNKRVVELLDSKNEKIYTSIDSTDKCDNDAINEVILPEYLNSLSPSNLPPHELHLKINCVVMLIRNLSINEGLCNGTRLLILELTNNLLRCKILTGDKTGEIVYLNRITLYCENIYPFTFKRRQFPVKLAFAMTINKSQGQTFRKIGVDLRRDVFDHGQLYVAFSRVRSWEALKVYLGNQRKTNIVKNYVFNELIK